MPKFHVPIAEYSAASVDLMMEDLQRLSYLARSSFEDDQTATQRELDAARETLGLCQAECFDAIEDAALAQGDVVLVETAPNEWMCYYLKRGQLDQVRTPAGLDLSSR